MLVFSAYDVYNKPCNGMFENLYHEKDRAEKPCLFLFYLIKSNTALVVYTYVYTYVYVYVYMYVYTQNKIYIKTGSRILLTLTGVSGHGFQQPTRGILYDNMCPL